MFVPSSQNPRGSSASAIKAEGLYYVISATRIEKSKKCRAPQLLKILRFRFYGVGQTVTLKNTRSRHSEHMRFLKAQAFRIRKCEMVFPKNPKWFWFVKNIFAEQKYFGCQKLMRSKMFHFWSKKSIFVQKWPKWPFFDLREKKHAGAGSFQKLAQNRLVSAKNGHFWPNWPKNWSSFITKL